MTYFQVKQDMRKGDVIERELTIKDLNTGSELYPCGFMLFHSLLSHSNHLRQDTKVCIKSGTTRLGMVVLNGNFHKNKSSNDYTVTQQIP